MSVNISEMGDHLEIHLGEELSIQDAPGFYSLISSAMESGKPIRVNAGAIKLIHTAIMQVLWIANRDRPTLVIGASSTGFQEAAKRMGLSFRS